MTPLFCGQTGCGRGVAVGVVEAVGAVELDDREIEDEPLVDREFVDRTLVESELVNGEVVDKMILDDVEFDGCELVDGEFVDREIFDRKLADTEVETVVVRPPLLRESVANAVDVEFPDGVIVAASDAEKDACMEDTVDAVVLVCEDLLLGICNVKKERTLLLSEEVVITSVDD